MLEPGLTPAQSAEAEAAEEAGVLGIVEDRAVSSYRYTKRGLWPTQVTLFPMRVHKVLSDEDWEEAGFRERDWFALSAARAVLPPELHHVLDDFAAWL